MKRSPATLHALQPAHLALSQASSVAPCSDGPAARIASSLASTRRRHLRGLFTGRRSGSSSQRPSSKSGLGNATNTAALSLIVIHREHQSRIVDNDKFHGPYGWPSSCSQISHACLTSDSVSGSPFARRFRRRNIFAASSSERRFAARRICGTTYASITTPIKIFRARGLGSSFIGSACHLMVAVSSPRLVNGGPGLWRLVQPDQVA